MAVRGTEQTLSFTFRDQPGGVIVDPTLVTLTVTLNGTAVLGPLSVPPVIKDGPGLYHYAWLIPAASVLGTYVVAWSGVLPGGAAATVGYEQIEVTATDGLHIPNFGVCVWPVDPACETSAWLAFSATVRARALALASSTLTRLTGYRVSNCPVTVRPAPQRGHCFIPTQYADSGFTLGMDGAGRWVNNCGTSTINEGIVLPAPVGRIDAVMVDGVALSPTNYLINGNTLVWMGGGVAPWPLSQDMSIPLGQPGTFSVTYLNAYPVDSLGAYAVGLLALEFAKACSGGKCRLPSGVTSIVRAGISMEITAGAFIDGFTGIREVDTYIALWNPAGLRQPSTVWHPGLRGSVTR